MIWRTVGSSSATRRGVKTLLTSWRTRVCSGGSMMIIIGSGVSPCSRVGPMVELKVSWSRWASQTSSKRESAQNPSFSLW